MKKYTGKHMSAEGMHRGNRLKSKISLFALVGFYFLTIDLFYYFLVGFCGHTGAFVIYLVLGMWMAFTRGGHAFVKRRYLKLKYYYTLAFLQTFNI